MPPLHSAQGAGPDVSVTEPTFMHEERTLTIYPHQSETKYTDLTLPGGVTGFGVHNLKVVWQNRATGRYQLVKVEVLGYVEGTGGLVFDLLKKPWVKGEFQDGVPQVLIDLVLDTYPQELT